MKLLHISFLVILAGALCTWLFGRQGMITLYKGAPTNEFILSDGQVVRLPFLVSLEDFQIQTDSGTGAPLDYISTLHILKGDTGRVSMNHPFNYKGYRFCQQDFNSSLTMNRLLLSHDPYGVPLTYLGYALLLAGIVAFLFQKKSFFHTLLLQEKPVSPFYAIVGVSIAVGLLVGKSVEERSVGVPILRTFLLPIHVSLIVSAYSLMAGQVLLGIAALSHRKWILPLYRLSHLLLYPAVFLLAAGIIIGAVWAQVSWGQYWSWDPKETWALITLLVYSLPLHSKSLPFFRKPHPFHLYLIAAFLCVLFTYFGVNYLLGGLHSYGA